MTDHDITEIADARYMGLMCPPASPEAKVLVADIVNSIEQAEQRQRARTAAYDAAFRSAVGLIFKNEWAAARKRITTSIWPIRCRA